ncbi:MAG TPA: TauD/TfdA family dioxygenase [Rubrivivax sp.]
MLKVEKLSEVAGARITGLDVAQPLSAQDFAAIEAALHEHTFIVLPAQTLSPQQFVAFGRRWGPPEPHVIDTFHHPVDNNILMLSNVKRDGKPIGLLDAGTYFHTDYSYLTVPARCTILHAIQMPRENAGTRFANQTRAYADLPDAMRQRIDDLVVRHHYGNRDDLRETSRTVASVLNESQKKKVDWVRHRLARPHPRTGVKALYAVSGSSFGIDGMVDADAVALLDELKEHATQARYCHTHHYRIGDVIVWDNSQLLHAAPLTDLSDARTLWRVTVKEAG